jgi:nitrogen fixation NifU-like protein
LLHSFPTRRSSDLLKFDGDRISEIAFQGSGCAISKASASMMSTILKGKSKEEAEQIFHQFHHLVTGSVQADEDIETLGKLAAFAGVSEFPARVKCASLAWHTVHSALQGDQKIISTE